MPVNDKFYLLQVLVRQEITRKIGLSLQPEEEVLTRRFEAMHSQISAPTQYKGRISEMLSQLRMRRHIDIQNQERYTMDPIAQDDIKAVNEYSSFFFSRDYGIRYRHNRFFSIILVPEYGTTGHGATYCNNKYRFRKLKNYQRRNVGSFNEPKYILRIVMYNKIFSHAFHIVKN